MYIYCSANFQMSLFKSEHVVRKKLRTKRVVIREIVFKIVSINSERSFPRGATAIKQLLLPACLSPGWGMESCYLIG